MAGVSGSGPAQQNKPPATDVIQQGRLPIRPSQPQTGILSPQSSFPAGQGADIK